MFVRIVYLKPGAEGSDIVTREVLQECKKIQITNLDVEHIRLVVDDQIHELSKAHNEVYFMNELGKTIDSYRWANNPISDELRGTEAG